MAEQFADKGLAKTHHFGRALAFGVKVGTAFAAAHRQRGQGVFEGLFKRQELQHRQVDRGVETDAALVRADGHAVLNAVAPVDLHLAMVVHPRHPEHHHALGLDQPVQQTMFGVFGVGLNERPQAFHHLGDGLQKLWLTWIALCDVLEKLLYVGVLHKNPSLVQIDIKAPFCTFYAPQNGFSTALTVISTHQIRPSPLNAPAIFPLFDRYFCCFAASSPGNAHC